MLTINIDSTALGAASCLEKMRKIIIEGYTDKVKPASMVYGIGVHKYCDTMYRTKGDIGQAKDKCLGIFRRIPKVASAKQDHLMDERHMLVTAFNYWDNYLKVDGEFELIDRGDGIPLSERTFSYEIYRDTFITVNLQGTTDGIGKIKGGCYAVRDFKTTSSWDAKNYFGQYEMNRQLMIYILALKYMAKLEPDSILGKIGATRLGGFIDAIFVKPHVADNIYMRSPVYSYDDTQLKNFEEMLHMFCRRLSEAVHIDYWPLEGLLNGTCMSRWGRCFLWNICKQTDPKVKAVLLERDFEKKEFQPLRYNEE